MTDVCLCEDTSHGHCGVLVEDRATGEIEIANDATVELLAKAALSHAIAGADIVAPSDMMDGRVGAIRVRSTNAGFERRDHVGRGERHRSAFYGPFREAADSAPAFGDRRSHQMDPANAEEALREVRLISRRGPTSSWCAGAAYLDVISPGEGGVRRAHGRVSRQRRARDAQAAVERGWLDEERAMLETLTSIARAGADIILTYYAREAARLPGTRAAVSFGYAFRLMLVSLIGASA